MTNKSKIKNINELEYINGKIYANTYQLNRDVVIIINPKNGTVEGVIDFTGIRDLVKKSPDLDVMNDKFGPPLLLIKALMLIVALVLFSFT